MENATYRLRPVPVIITFLGGWWLASNVSAILIGENTNEKRGRCCDVTRKWPIPKVTATLLPPPLSSAAPSRTQWLPCRPAQRNSPRRGLHLGPAHSASWLAWADQWEPAGRGSAGWAGDVNRRLVRVFLVCGTCGHVCPFLSAIGPLDFSCLRRAFSPFNGRRVKELTRRPSLLIWMKRRMNVSVARCRNFVFDQRQTDTDVIDCLTKIFRAADR